MKKRVSLFLLGLAVVCSLTTSDVRQIHAEPIELETGTWLGMDYVLKDEDGVITCYISGTQTEAKTSNNSFSNLFSGSENKPTRIVFSDCIFTKEFSNFLSSTSNLKEIVFGSNIDFSAVTKMDYAFAFCSDLETVDFSGLDTSNVTAFNGMFCQDTKLKSVNTEELEADLVTSTNSMFFNCNSLLAVDLSTWNTANVTNASGMFSSNTKLKEVKMASSFGGAVNNYSQMFYECRALDGIDMSKFSYTGNDINMSSMFYECDSLRYISLDGLDMSNVQRMSSIFYGCESLSTMTWGDVNLSNVKYLDQSFKDCTSLREADMSEVIIPSCPISMYDMWKNDTSLTKVIFPTTETKSSTCDISGIVSGCTSLKVLDLSRFTDTHSINNDVFYGQALPSLYRIETPANTSIGILIYKDMYRKSDWVKVDRMPAQVGSITLLSKLPTETVDSIRVTAERNSALYVSIPKSVILTYDEASGKDKARYSVKLYGDFAGGDSIDLSISKSVNMAQDGKAVIAADNKTYSDDQYSTQTTGENAEQDKWVINVTGDSLFNATDAENAYVWYCEMTTTSKLTAGKWNGTAAFSVKSN